MSLVTTPTATLSHCPLCDSTRVTEITMTLTDGSLVDFVSCHTCENKSWKSHGETLELDSVLAKAQKHK